MLEYLRETNGLTQFTVTTTRLPRRGSRAHCQKWRRPVYYCLLRSLVNPITPDWRCAHEARWREWGFSGKPAPRCCEYWLFLDLLVHHRCYAVIILYESVTCTNWLCSALYTVNLDGNANCLTVRPPRCGRCGPIVFRLTMFRQHLNDRRISIMCRDLCMNAYAWLHKIKKSMLRITAPLQRGFISTSCVSTLLTLDYSYYLLVRRRDCTTTHTQ